MDKKNPCGCSHSGLGIMSIWMSMLLLILKSSSCAEDSDVGKHFFFLSFASLGCGEKVNF